MTGESSSIRWVPRPSHQFDAASLRLGTVSGERHGTTILSTAMGGPLVYGPYLALPSGSYEARIWGTATSDCGSQGHVDAAIGGGLTMLGRSEITPASKTEVQVTLLARLAFTLDKGCDDLEVRVWADPQTKMVFHRLDICEVNPL
jgi:hypothetical protein